VDFAGALRALPRVHFPQPELGADALKSVTERIKCQRNAARFWCEMRKVSWKELADLVTPWVTRKCHLRSTARASSATRSARTTTAVAPRHGGCSPLACCCAGRCGACSILASVRAALVAL
jgi:hypothetical protein